MNPGGMIVNEVTLVAETSKNTVTLKIIILFQHISLLLEQ